MKGHKIISFREMISYFSLLVICSALIGGAAVAVSKISGEFVNYFVMDKKENSILLYLIIFFGALLMCIILKHYFYKVTTSINSKLKLRIYESMVDSKFEDFSLKEGKGVTLLDQDTDSITSLLENQLSELVEGVVTGLIMGIVTFTINKVIFVVIMLLSFLSSISIFLYKKNTKIQMQYLKELDKLNNNSFDIVRAIPIFNSLQNINILMKRINIIIDKSCKLDFKNKLIIIFFDAVARLCSVAREFFVIIYGFYFAKMDIGTIVATLNITSFYGEFVKSVGELIIELAKVRVSKQRIEGLLNGDKEALEFEAYDHSIDEIKIEDVEYMYAESAGLKKCSMNLVHDKVNIIVGDIGTGKSTFGKILSGLISPQNGKIIINNQAMTLNQLRSAVAYVDQDSIMSTGTVEENVSSFDNEISSNKVLDCIEKAGLGKWIESMKDGIKSELNSEKVNLSGGQKQRLAIARALYKNSPVILLDEPSSALDYDNVKNLINQILELRNSKMIIIITHDLRLVRGLDGASNLVVFE